MFARALFVVVAATTVCACTSAKTSSVTAPSATDRCQVTITNASSTFTASGGSASAAVTTARDCTWTATSSTSWLSINGATSGQGNGTLSYAVAANQVPSPRSGSIAVSSEHISVTQEAAPCRFSLSRS